VRGHLTVMAILTCIAQVSITRRVLWYYFVYVYSQANSKLLLRSSYMRRIVLPLSIVSPHDTMAGECSLAAVLVIWTAPNLSDSGFAAIPKIF
jgi:hypothetical protein